jgi:DNA-binding MarR family transcriptional regulator
MTLTPDGESVLRLLQQQTKRLNAKAVAGLTKAQQRDFAELLQRVKANLASGD